MATIHFKLTRDKEIPVEVFEATVLEVFDLIVSATPVDTGFAISQWFIAITKNICNIWNEAEYISFLEDGWSDQAPDGMVGPALDQLPDILTEKYDLYLSGQL